MVRSGPYRRMTTASRSPIRPVRTDASPQGVGTWTPRRSVRRRLEAAEVIRPIGASVMGNLWELAVHVVSVDRGPGGSLVDPCELTIVENSLAGDHDRGDMLRARPI